MKIKKKEIINIISGVFTIYGIYLFIKGDLTNGLLSMILGEVIN